MDLGASLWYNDGDLNTKNGISKTLLDKEENLREAVRDLGSAAVAFSSGVDSTYLLHVASEVLPSRAVAFTAAPRSMPPAELESAVRFCKSRGIRHEIVRFDEFSVPGFAENPPDRCYHCKKALFGRFSDLARELGLAAVLEGSNTDDSGDYRPGRRAIRELGVLSPLADAGLSKAEIRELSRRAGLPTWRKPSAACLASRFPYGERITPEALERVGKAESLLASIVGEDVPLRVRCHGTVARIETARSAFPAILERAEEISSALKSLGFAYTSLDLLGYRTGSLNAVLTSIQA